MLTEKIDNVTNDFNIKAEKKPALSTVKKQAKQLNSLIAATDFSQKKIITNQTFDRLKIWIDLDKYGKKIKFKKGVNLVKSDHPSLPPYKQYQQSLELRKNNKGSEYDYDAYEEYMEEYDDEVVENKEHKNIYQNCSIDYDLYKKIVGINNIYILNDKLVIDITGKFMAEYGILGLISIENIIECLKKIQNLSLFSFDIDEFLRYAGCYIADVTQDIDLVSSSRVKRMIQAMSSFAPMMSDTCINRKYKRHGLLIKRKTENTGHSCLVYDKGEDISNSIKMYNKAVKYTETIGNAGEVLAKRTLRLECHIYKMADLRKLLNIPAKEKGFVSLMAVLKSKEPVILKMLKEMGVNELKLYNSLTYFQLNENFFNEKEFITEEQLEVIIKAEWLANLIIENDYQLDKVKSHIGIEYGFDLSDEYFQKLMPTLKEHLQNYLCYRKPRSVSSILLLLMRIKDEYYDEEMQQIKKKILQAT